jgi:cell division inhibitor SulA
MASRVRQLLICKVFCNRLSKSWVRGIPLPATQLAAISASRPDATVLSEAKQIVVDGLERILTGNHRQLH